MQKEQLHRFSITRLFYREKHGCVALGKDVQEAFDLIDVMNKSAQLFFICRDADYPPQGPTEQQIEELKKKLLLNPGTD